MIALWREWNHAGRGPERQIAASLGLFAGQAAASASTPGRVYSQLREPRPAVRRGARWQPHVTVSGATVLFNGWIDNQREIAAELGIAPGDAPALYGAAVERWGEGADAHLNGCYCAIVDRPDAIRLSRSPWSPPPLIYFDDGEHAVVASVPRVLFAAGVPKSLDLAAVADGLYFSNRSSTAGWYERTQRV